MTASLTRKQSADMHERHVLSRSQVGQVVLNLLRAQLPEPGAFSTLHTLESKQTVLGGSNDTCTRLTN